MDRGRYHGGTGFPQPIALAEIKAYAEVQSFGKSELEDLCHYVRELDTIYLRHQIDKKQRESKSGVKRKHG